MKLQLPWNKKFNFLKPLEFRDIIALDETNKKINLGRILGKQCCYGMSDVYSSTENNNTDFRIRLSGHNLFNLSKF